METGTAQPARSAIFFEGTGFYTEEGREQALRSSGNLAMKTPSQWCHYLPVYGPIKSRFTMALQYFRPAAALSLECGSTLPNLQIAYRTYGRLNASRSNVVWVAHALTGDTQVADWWAELVGVGKPLDPSRYFIICANNLGSCYGTTGPSSINPATGHRYGLDFPTITTRDMARAHDLLRRHLGIEQIALGIGGSMGGQVLLEWAADQSDRFRKLILLATNAQHSPWGIAFNEAQRLAIHSDPTLRTSASNAGQAGLIAARAVAMLSYRNYETYAQQRESEPEKLENYRASTYQRHQGIKLANRFDAFTYLTLSKAMDAHHLGRGRGGVAQVLRTLLVPTLVIGIHSDLLFPVAEQQFLATHLPNARLSLIESDYGHDGFLTETQTLAPLLSAFINNTSSSSQAFVRQGIPGTESF